MSSPQHRRARWIGPAVVVVPLVPVCAAGPAARLFGWDPHSAEIAGGLFTALLFAGALGIAIELVRRDEDESG